MKKIKVFVKKNYKVVISFILGMIVCIGIGVSAVATKDIVYDNSKSGLTSTNLQGAIDELNDKAKTHCPDGKICINRANQSKPNSNIVIAYTYNQTSGASNYCITGEESTCVETPCYFSDSENSCEAGTIVKYRVNDKYEINFYVLHDDGTTMTLQQRENTIYGKAWNSSVSASKGPTDILSALESETAGWTNVNDQTYTMGTTNFNNTNSYTGCDSYNNCTYNVYTWESRISKVRMITLQEAAAVGCTTTSKSCPIWMNNYLRYSTSDGGTVDDEVDGFNNYAYNTMSGTSKRYCFGPGMCVDTAWKITQSGTLVNDPISSPAPAGGARAVVVISK